VLAGPAEYALGMNHPFVVVAGSASRDITSADPRGWRLGGAVTYASLALARLGLGVGAVVGVDAAAAGAREIADLEAAGAIVIRVPLAAGPVFELADGPRGRTVRARSASDRLAVTSTPRAWLSQGTPAFLGPVAGELGEDWAALGGSELALGWQGLLREIRPDGSVTQVAPAPHRLLEVATIVGLSREDTAPELDAGALAALLRPGATLIRTDGIRGGEVVRVDATGRAAAPEPYTAVASDGVIDPTGAGDVFLAAMLAARLDPTLGPDLDVAAAAASLVVEAPGLDGVPTRAAVRERMRRAASLASRWDSDDSSRASGRPSQA